MAMAVTPQPPRLRRFTADEVWQMVHTGILGPDEPYELIDGELCFVSPQGPPHAWVISNLNGLFVHRYATGFTVRVQMPIGGIADSIPEPDLAVVPWVASMDAPHPRADEALLIVEVSHTSRPTDVRKAAIYAKAGAPEYWIVDANRHDVTVHTGPRRSGTWQTVNRLTDDSLLALPGGREAALPVSRVFGTV